MAWTITAFGSLPCSIQALRPAAILCRKAIPPSPSGYWRQIFACSCLRVLSCVVQRLRIVRFAPHLKAALGEDGMSLIDFTQHKRFGALDVVESLATTNDWSFERAGEDEITIM